MTYEISVCKRDIQIVDKEIYYNIVNNITDYGMIITNKIETSTKCHIDIEWNPHEKFYIPQ